MNLIKKIIIIFFLLIPISVSFASMVTLVDRQIFDDGGQAFQNGIVFNPDGTKMFVSPQVSTGNANIDFIYEYNLSTPFDISTKTYAGDDERCDLDVGSGQYGLDPKVAGDLAFSSDGLKIFILSRGTNGSNNDRLYRYDLTIAYDVSTCAFVKDIDPDTDALAGTSFGGRPEKKKYHVQGVEINPDGTKIFLVFNDAQGAGDGVKEYNLSTPYDIATMSLVTSGGIHLSEGAEGFNPDAIFIGLNGKRLFVADHQKFTVTQYTLHNPYDTSSFTKDGSVSIQNLTSDNNRQTRALGFSKSGFKMFVSDDEGDDEIFEFDLVCPFNIITGKCSPITKNKDRTGIAMAQIEIAKRTIEQSTDTALNRLKWIRRNKDKQNLTNLNIDFNFTNQRLASLTEVVRTSAAKKKKKNKDENRDIFYWSEGSISVGKIGDTIISSAKEINTNRITVGADKFLNNKGLRGLAFSVGRNNIDVGNAGSKVDADNFNITYYSTSAMKNDEKFIDTVFGIGKIHSEILTVLDGKKLTADRKGKQIFGTIKIKDEIKGGRFTFIPSGQFDIGHTLLDDYEEVGVGGIIVENQHVRTRNLRAALAAVEDVSNENFTIKRHGKIEYKADIDRSSDFKYKYKNGAEPFNDTLHVGALHNISGELGVDIVFPENYSIFIIYEREQAIDYGHTDNLHIAIGYLPNKNTNFAIQLEGIDNTEANYIFSKNINDFLIDLKLTNHLMRPDDYEEASFNLRRKF